MTLESLVLIVLRSPGKTIFQDSSGGQLRTILDEEELYQNLKNISLTLPSVECVISWNKSGIETKFCEV